MINKIINFSVHNKLITGFLLGIFMLWGIYSFTQLSVDALPDVTNNQVQVITNSPNLATQEVEQFITTPLELEFKSLQGLVELRSTSRSGLSVITIVFKDNMPLNITRQLVAEKIKVAQENIPKEYGQPDLIPPTTGLGEIYQYVIAPKRGYEDKFTSMDLRTVQDWIVKRQLLGTSGVVDVSSFGGKLKQYEVSVKPERLAAMNLTLLDVYTALQKNNSNTGGSYIDKGPNVYFIRGEGLIEKLSDISNIVVSNTKGIPVLVKDIGTVDFGFAPRYGALTRNGKGETVGGVVLMQKGENAVRVIKRVKERMATIEKYLPEGLSIDVFVDRTKLIERATHTVSTNLLEGALIVIFVLVLFLGNFRAGLIVASVIPLSMLFAVAVMNMFGVSANLMSMGALDFGLIVDGAVIIVESLTHKFFQDFRGQKLSQIKMDEEVTKGSSKIMTSAVFGQIIILIVYIPIFALSGIEGKMFMPMAQTVSFAIIGAMILSITYVPLVSSLFLNKKIAGKENITDKAMKWLTGRYQPFLQRIITHRIPVLMAAVALFIGSLFVFNSLGGEFIPELDEGDFAVNYAIRQGSSLPQSIETSTHLESIAMQFPEVKEVVSKIGSSEIPTDPMPIESGDVMIVLKDKKDWTSAKNKEELAEKMNEKMSVIPGVNLTFEQPIQMRFNELIAGVKSDIAIKVFGSDLEVLFAKGNEISKLIKNIPGLTDVKVEQIVGMPQLVVKYNRSKIAQYGLNISDVNATLNTAYAGGYAGVIYEGEKKFDLVVRITKDPNTDADILKALLIPLPTGRQIPLSEIADVTFKASPAQISREDAERRIVVEANTRGRDVESVVKDIQQTLDAKIKLPEGYYITYGGQFQNLQEAKGRLQLAVPVSLLLIFFLLFLTFRSAKEAIIIFSAIPLAAIGGILALWLRGMNFSISAGVGFIALFGVAVLNGIVLISYYNRLKEEGEDDITKRILKGSSARLRPVLATAAVASLGFLPMAFSMSAGAEVQKPLATVVIGGLFSSTILTLFVLPVLYSLFYLKRKKKMKVNTTAITLFLIMFSVLGFNANAQSPKLTLQNALEIATKNYPTIQQASLQTQQQKALTGTATILDPFNINTAFGQINSNVIDYNVGVAQGFKLPNAYKAEKNLLSQNVAVAQSYEAVTKSELLRNVSNAYYNWLYSWQQYNLLLQTDSIFADYEKYANKKYQVGESNKLEKINATLQRKDLMLQLAHAQTQVSFYLADLQKWLRTNQQYQAPEEFTSFPEINLSDSNLVNKHPVLQFLQQQLVAKELAIKAEKAKGQPSFNLGVNAQSLDRQRQFYYGSVGVNIPIFKNGVKARTQAARFETEIAKKELDKSQQEITTLFLQQNQLQQQSLQQLRYYQTEGLPMAESIINAAQRSYKAGDIGYIEYIQNIKDAIRIKTEYLVAVNNYNQTIIQLNYLLNR
ncbi:CusA/CzcA family heavy metal efflux RND transporter [Limnovirga soli]|uniref:CusA/CzcA family heavy metal efflux RND transporter n=1 Tax=Limnovirga soli TaxID=2656915 RepID=A0A8J8JWJ2_9BACT|nr:CusA/CzcA family heavy metal efflux RND transporter [Limnovirga soli]NNV57799.1 CusA/CzcA family heavy metal efflux RND transporter [Limnovirga soli]